MERVFVRSAQLDEHFYALTDGVKLYDEKGVELHESFVIMDKLEDCINEGLYMSAALCLGVLALSGIFSLDLLGAIFTIVLRLCNVIL